MGLIRLLFFGLIGLSVIYFLISIYSRSVRREKLEDEWAETHPDDTDSDERDAFIEAGSGLSMWSRPCWSWPS